MSHTQATSPGKEIWEYLWFWKSVKRHLTDPEYWKLCDGKEGGHPRHDIAEPDRHDFWFGKDHNKRVPSPYLNRSMRNPKTKRDKKLVTPLPPNDCTALIEGRFKTFHKHFDFQGKLSNSKFNLQSKRRACHRHWEWKPAFSSRWRKRCQWWGRTAWENWLVNPKRVGGWSHLAKKRK